MPRTYQSQHAGSSRRAPRPPEPEEEEDEGEQDYQQPEEENGATQAGSSGMTDEVSVFPRAGLILRRACIGLYLLGHLLP